MGFTNADGSVVIKVVVDDGDAQKSIKELRGEIVDVGDGMEEASNSASSFGDALKSHVLGGVVLKGLEALGGSVRNMAAYALEAGQSFDAGMSNVAAISGAAADELDALRNKAKEMGASTVFSATQAADALQYMAMAGWNTESMLDGVEGIMNLAAASGEDLAMVSDIVTDALTAFGLSAADSGHFADVLAAASSSANTNVGMLGESFKYVAPVAGAMGFSVEDVSVALGLMANSGIKASQAGTSLRSMLSRLASPTKDVQAALDALGVSLTNSDGSIKEFSIIIDELRAGFSGLTEAEKTQAAANLAGQEAMSGLLAIVNTSDADFAKLTESINNADGTAQAMAGTMTDNLPGAITIAKSALEGAAVALYEKFEQPATEAVKGVTGAITSMTEAFQQNGLSGVVGTIGDMVNQGVQALISGISGMGERLKGHLPDFISVGLDMVSGLAASIRENTGLLVDGAISLAEDFAQGLADSIPVIIEKAPQIVSDLANTINDNAPKLLKAAANILITLGKGLIGAIPTLIQNIPQIIAAIVDVFLAFNWLNIGKTIVTGLGNGLKSMVSSLKGIAKQLVEAIKGGFANLPQAMTGIGKNIVQGLWKGIGAMKDWVLGKIKEFVGGIVGGVKNALGIHSPSKVFAGIGENISRGLANGIEADSGLAVAAVQNAARQIGGVNINSPNWAVVPSLSAQQIPRVAQGTVIPSNQQFTASVSRSASTGDFGERLASMERALENIVGQTGGSRQPIQVNVMLDKRVLARAMVNEVNDMTLQAGKPVLLI